MAETIHPTAIIDPKAELGKDVHVGPYVIIEQDTRIGDGTRIDAFTQIKQYTILGQNNHVHSYACIGNVPQDLKFQGEKSELVIGDNNTIREYVTMNRGTDVGGGVTRVGSGGLFMAYVHIAHDCIVGDQAIFSNGVTLGGHVRVGNNVIVGGLSAVHQFVVIGDHTFVGGMTGVAQDLPPYMLAAGSRAKVHGPNFVGLRRMNVSSDSIKALKSAYKIYWRSGLSKKEALDRIKKEYSNHKEIQEFLSFVKSSERGITPAN